LEKDNNGMNSTEESAKLVEPNQVDASPQKANTTNLTEDYVENLQRDEPPRKLVIDI
jgi:hypothetical protein